MVSEVDRWGSIPLEHVGEADVQDPGGGGRAVNGVMNVTTPDVAGFARSPSQIAAQINRALARGSRNS